MTNPIPRRTPPPELPNPFAPNQFGVTPQTQFPVQHQAVEPYVDYRSPGASTAAKPPSSPPSVVGNTMQYYSQMAQSPSPGLADYARQQAMADHALGIASGKQMFADNLAARKAAVARDRMIRSGFMMPEGFEQEMAMRGAQIPQHVRDELQRRAFGK